MSDGWWRIKQHAPNWHGGFMVTEIPVRPTTIDHGDGWIDTNAPTPAWEVNDTLIKIMYDGGKTEYFPLASVVYAEYQPPTKDTK